MRPTTKRDLLVHYHLVHGGVYEVVKWGRVLGRACRLTRSGKLEAPPAPGCLRVPSRSAQWAATSPDGDVIYRRGFPSKEAVARFLVLVETQTQLRKERELRDDDDWMG